MTMAYAPKAPPFQFARSKDDFVQWLQKERPQSEQVTAYTAQRYRRYAEDFCRIVGNPTTAKDDRIQQWRSSIDTVTVHGQTRPATPQTINVKIAAIRAFFEYLMARGVRSDNPAARVMMQRVSKRKPTAIPKEVLNTLFGKLYEGEDTETALQDRALLETLYGSGLRREEAATLTLGSIESRDSLLIRGGKGDKDRRTMISSHQYAALLKWCLYKFGDERTKALRGEISEDAAFEDLRKRFSATPLFYTTTGRALPSLEDPGNYVWRRAMYWFAQMGEERRAHDFRHSFVTHLLDGGADLLSVADMAGHSDVSTTRTYRGQGEETLLRARRIHPRG